MLNYQLIIILYSTSTNNPGIGLHLSILATYSTAQMPPAHDSRALGSSLELASIINGRNMSTVAIERSKTWTKRYKRGEMATNLAKEQQES